MRRVLLVLLPILLVFGIPWLASEFRGDDKAAAPAGATVSSTRDNQRAASVLPSQMLPSASSPQNAAQVKLVTVSLQPLQASPAAAGTTASLPANEAELVFAIHKELTRLGYYDGPATNKWNKAVRYAAHQFIRQTASHNRYGQPTIELLTALQATNPVKQREPRPLEANHRVVEPHPAGSILQDNPAKETAPASEAAPQDHDYLPPWMRSKTGHAAGGSSQADAGAPASPEGSEYRVHHQRHRSARGYAPRRRRTAFFFPF